MGCGCIQEPEKKMNSVLAIPKITVGMAVFDEFDTAAMTIQSLRLHHLAKDKYLDIVVVDNNPGSAKAERLRALCIATGAKYVPFQTPNGTSAPRDEIFRHGEGDIVAVIDCHVMLQTGALYRLGLWAAQHPDSMDLWHGPMQYDDLGDRSIATHMVPQWGPDLMYGQWGFDERGVYRDGPEFEIPMHGLGLFACWRKAWLGFPEGLRGFGGEEGMIHEKFRQSGRKVLCLPFLRWWHLFRDTTVPAQYPALLEDKFRNYMIWYRHLGLETDDLVERFRGRLVQYRFDEILDEFEPKKVTLVEKAWNLTKAVTKHVANGMPVVTDQEYDFRLRQCGLCDKLSAEGTCGVCGCIVEKKARWAMENCPHPDGDRWNQEIIVYEEPACQHNTYHADVDVQNMHDEANGTVPYRLATIRIRCKECGEPMYFNAQKNYLATLAVTPATEVESAQAATRP